MRPQAPTRRWYKRPISIAALIATILVPVLLAYFAYRQTRIAARASLPHVKLLSQDELSFRGPAGNGSTLWVCRTELELANNGGADTAIVGIQPTGPLNRSGYLPSFDFTVHELTAYLDGFVHLFNLWLPILVPSVSTTRLRGPFPYQLGITGAHGVGLIPWGNPPDTNAGQPARSPNDGVPTPSEIRNRLKATLNNAQLPFGFGSATDRYR